VVRRGHLIPRTACTRWNEVEGHDVRRWVVWLLGRCSDTYASNQYRALQQFFKWLAERNNSPIRWHGYIRQRSPRSWCGFQQRRTIEAGEGLPGPAPLRRQRPPRPRPPQLRPHHGHALKRKPATRPAVHATHALDARRQPILADKYKYPPTETGEESPADTDRGARIRLRCARASNGSAESWA
jgi:hypothetical protein